MVSVKNLVFDYMTKRALFDISFNIEKGSIVALVGANGAGKTTLMRCLAGLVKPFSGDITVAGINVPENAREAHRHVAYLSDVFGLYDDLTTGQCLRYAALAFDVPKNEIDGRIDEVAELLGLTPHMDTLAGNLSRGLRQKLAIAQGIIYKADFLILDEPASGLDPKSRIELSKVFLKLKDQGYTLLVSSHILAELEDYATEMIVLKSGRIVCQKKIGDDNTKIQNNRLNLAIRVHGSSKSLVKFLEKDDIIGEVLFDDNWISAEFWGKETEIPAYLKKLITSGFKVIEFGLKKTTLKDAYFGIFGKGE